MKNKDLTDLIEILKNTVYNIVVKNGAFCTYSANDKSKKNKNKTNTPGTKEENLRIDEENWDMEEESED